MEPPLGRLEYLYTGSDDLAADLRYYSDVLGARKVWHVRAFGAEVAALRVWDGPLVLLADHRPSPSVLPCFAVADLEATVEALGTRGWKATAGPFGIPNGPCYTFKDPSGNEYAVFQNDRPDAMDGTGVEDVSDDARGVRL